MSSVCRVCLSGGGNTTLSSIEDVRLLDVYKRLTNIQFESEDEKPRVVCCFCYQSLLKCWTLSEMAHRSETILTDLLFKGLEATQDTIKSLSLEIKQHLSVSPIQLTDLDDKNNTANGSSLITIQEEPISVKEEITIEVPMVNTEALDVHISEEFIKTEQKFEEDNDGENLIEHSSERDDDPLDSKEDIGKLESNQAVSRNQKVEVDLDDSMFRCDICNKKFLLRHNLLRHIQLSHSNKKCDKSNRKCRTVSRIDTREKIYICDTCDKQFNKKYNIVKHLKIHFREREYPCSMCDKQYCQKSDLVIHMRTHTGELPYACDICDKHYNRKSDLAIHKRIHSGEKPHACSICDKQFIQKSNLVTHMRVHTGEKPFSCSVCFKQWAQKSSLVSHMRIHTGERPYACTSCDKKFNQRYTLVSHTRLHTGEKPYTCSICLKQCNQRSILIRHMRIHTGEKPYACSKCEKKFGEKSSLTKHFRLHCKRNTEIE